MQNTNYNIPVIIVSGFLGAGKTTFIQKLVSSRFSRVKTVILENEFGTIDLDGEVLKEHGFSVVSVQGGCICCTGIGDFTGAIQEAVETLAPELIIIEPTGVAKLSEVLAQFKLPPLSQLCSLSQIITIADAQNFEERHFISEQFYENQLQNSNVIFLSKTELLSKEDIGAVANQIHTIAPKSLLIVDPWEALSEDQQEVCLEYKKSHTHYHSHGSHKGCSCSSPECSGYHNHDHHHHNHDEDHLFSTYSIECKGSAEFLQNKIDEITSGSFGDILRIKGVVKSSDETWQQVDYVPGQFKISSWVGTPPKFAYLTFIGIRLSEDALNELLNT